MSRKRTAEEEKLRAQLLAVSPNEDAADIDEILILMKRATDSGKDMPPSTSRLIQKSKAADAGSNAARIYKARKREEVEDRTLKASNQKKRQEAIVRYRRYRAVAASLVAGNPRLQRATKNHLAKTVQAELARRKGETVSLRTLLRAIRPENKV
jgi:hypothetical protein